MTRTWTPESEEPKPRTGVDYHTVKAWFQQCRDMAAAVEAQKQKIQRIREVAEKTTPSLNGMPGGGGAGDKVGLAATDITDEQRRLQQMETDLCLLRIEATRRAYCITASKSSKNRLTACACTTSRTKSSARSARSWGFRKKTRFPSTSSGAASIWQRFGTTSAMLHKPHKTRPDFLQCTFILQISN